MHLDDAALADDILELRVARGFVPELARAPMYLLDIFLRCSDTRVGQIVVRRYGGGPGGLGYARARLA